MADGGIIDIIHRLSFQLEGQGLNEAANALGKQISQLEQLQAEQKQYQAERSQGNKKSQAEQDAITDALKRNKQQQEQLTASIKGSATEHSKLLSTLTKETGELGKIEARISALKTLRKTASNEAIQGYTKEIAVLQEQQKKLTSTGATGGLLSGLVGGTAGGIGRQILQGSLLGLGIGGGFGIVTRVVSGLTDSLKGVGSEILNTSDFQEKLKASTDSLIGSIEKEIQTLNNLDPVLLNYQQRTVELENQINLLKTIGAVDLQIYDNKKKINDLEKQDAANTLDIEKKKLDNQNKITAAVYAAKNAVLSAGPNVPNAVNLAGTQAGQIGNLRRIQNVFTQQAGGDKDLEKALNDIYNEIKKSGADNRFRPLLNQQFDQILKKLNADAVAQQNAIDKAQGNLNTAQIKLIRENAQEEDKLNEDLRIRNLQEDNKLRQDQIKAQQERIRITQQIYNSDLLITKDYNLRREDLQLSLSSRLLQIDNEQTQKTRELRGKGQSLDAVTVAYYDDLRAKARKETAAAQNIEEQKAIQELQAFHLAQLNAEREAQESILKAKTTSLQAQLTELQKDGEDTLAIRSEILQNQQRIEENELNKKYFAEISAQKKLGNDTAALETEREEELLFINNKYGGLQIDLLTSYYTDRLNNIKRYSDVEASITKGNAAEQKTRSAQDYEDGIKSLRKFHKDVQRENFEATQKQKEQDLKDAQLRLQEAKANLGRLLSNPNTSQADLDRAAISLNGAKTDVGNATVNNTNKGTFRNGFGAFITDNSINDPALTKQQQLQKEVIATADTYQQLSEIAVKSFDTILEAQQKALDREISIRQERVTVALALAERGNTEALGIEQKRLDDAQRQKSQAAKKEAEINAALTVSNSLVAIAKAASAGAGYASIATVLAVIAALGAGYAAVEGLSAQNQPGFKKGGYTGSGSANEVAGVVHREEFVVPADKYADPVNKAILNHMYKGTLGPMLSSSLPLSAASHASKNDLRDTNRKLDAVVEAINSKSTKLGVNIDKRGVSAMVQEETARDRYNFQG